MKKDYLVLFFSTLFILLGYLVATHPFEIPDEQSHFASTNFLVEEGRMPTPKDPKNLSVEEHKTERLFGIMSEGQNKYSYHPEFRLEPTNTKIGKYEDKIKSLNLPENRSTYTIHQAALYPPLYYWFASIFYRLAYSKDIISRLFATRFASLIISAFIPVIAYLIGNNIFKEKKLARTLALLTLFFPMSTYIGVGINSDNLHNLLFGLAVLLSLQLIKLGPSKKLSLQIGTIISLDLLTKPQAYILFPIFFCAFIARWRLKEIKDWLKHLPYIIFPILILAGWQEIPKFFANNPYVAKISPFGGLAHFKIYTTSFFKTLLTEMIVWYWGVFKWFGVIMPRFWWWTANRLLGLSFIGLALKLHQDFKAKKITYLSKVIIFSLLANLSYLLALFWFDWQFYQEYGRSLGMQARYFMPLLITQMSLMLIGLLQLGWNKKVKQLITTGLVIFFLGLHLTSLYTQLTSYYDLLPFTTFINQVSQYKPFFAKGSWWSLWIPLYFLGVISITNWTISKQK